MPRIGASTLFAWDEGYSPRLFQTIEQRRHLLWEVLDDSRLRLTEEVADKFNAMHKDHGIRFSVHTPFMDKDIFSSDEMKREESIKDVRRSLELANRYEAEFAVIHPAYRNDTLPFDEIAGILADLLDYSERVGVIGVLENLSSKTMLYKPEDLFAFKRAINKPNFMLDLGHANVEDNLHAFIDVIREFSYFHIHDNVGDRDSHFPLGKGSINWDLFFSKVIQSKPDAPLVIENITLRDLDESVQFALKRLS